MSTQTRKHFISHLRSIIRSALTAAPQPPQRNANRVTRRGRSLRMEALENRQLFAVNVSLSGFQLNIEGDNQSNGISVETASAGAPLVVKEYQNGSY